MRTVNWDPLTCLLYAHTYVERIIIFSRLSQCKFRQDVLCCRLILPLPSRWYVTFIFEHILNIYGVFFVRFFLFFLFVHISCSAVAMCACVFVCLSYFPFYQLLQFFSPFYDSRFFSRSLLALYALWITDTEKESIRCVLRIYKVTNACIIN